MARQEIFRFLEALVANNSKEWMDQNRAWYELAKQEVVKVFDPILDELKSFDPRIVQPTARKSLNRINNNLMFHPDRPTYKDHFGIGFGYGKGLADFYIHLGVDELLIAGGLWHPPTDKLKKLRMEVDYEGDRLQGILEEEYFNTHFQLYSEDKLTNAPKGFDKNHPQIELMKMKSLAAFRPINRVDFLSDDFSELVVSSYKAVVPMLDFINVAITDGGFLE
ncbi:DUF2461 domain-containing protein [Roseivirga pacifica]|uniref:DUF2461 domain-containing protein n=1 Tax=Roseivirga pacifica TaxID=1267423 RepID=UPI00209529B9|nr:DUF2461 domain-containing protein [Roseivirga pacifica]MCO6357401.1 TIGR02453 family protein [Roseivirga pacifica]MCO6367835.1 TIGR02453 family protein [Roseivirga pacifica]MCO6369634.1 TIGR02453 family protein [Roseivirga pacifica]MCO6373488.1 TIGR02453 family protein [Roseivirga pacifica]MCO6377207.1 TIGR02453 family protein [Roseivirga pacifica]